MVEGHVSLGRVGSTPIPGTIKNVNTLTIKNLAVDVSFIRTVLAIESQPFSRLKEKFNH